MPNCLSATCKELTTLPLAMCRFSGNLGASTYGNPMGLAMSEQGFLYLFYVNVQMITPIIELQSLCIPNF
jgi:hypothetical protein